MTMRPTEGLIQERIAELHRTRDVAMPRGPRRRPIAATRNGVGVGLERFGLWLQVRPRRDVHGPVSVAR